MPQRPGAIDLRAKLEELVTRCALHAETISCADLAEIHRLRIWLAMPNGEHYYRMLLKADELRAANPYFPTTPAAAALWE